MWISMMTVVVQGSDLKRTLFTGINVYWNQMERKVWKQKVIDILNA